MKQPESSRSGGLKYQAGKKPARRLRGDDEIRLEPGQVLRIDLASGGCWYGHGFAHRQPYPLNVEPVVNTSFAVNNAQSPVWMCSAGFVIFADTTEQPVQRSQPGNERGEEGRDRQPGTDNWRLRVRQSR